MNKVVVLKEKEGPENMCICGEGERRSTEISLNREWGHFNISYKFQKVDLLSYLVSDKKTPATLPPITDQSLRSMQVTSSPS